MQFGKSPAPGRLLQFPARSPGKKWRVAVNVGWFGNKRKWYGLKAAEVAAIGLTTLEELRATAVAGRQSKFAGKCCRHISTSATAETPAPLVAWLDRADMVLLPAGLIWRYASTPPAPAARGLAGVVNGIVLRLRAAAIVLCWRSAARLLQAAYYLLQLRPTATPPSNSDQPGTDAPNTGHTPAVVAAPTPASRSKSAFTPIRSRLIAPELVLPPSVVRLIGPDNRCPFANFANPVPKGQFA